MALDGLGHFSVNGVQLHCSDHTVLLEDKEKGKKRVGEKNLYVQVIKDQRYRFKIQAVCLYVYEQMVGIICAFG